MPNIKGSRCAGGRLRVGHAVGTVLALITVCAITLCATIMVGRFYARESVYCYRNSVDFRLGITARVIRHFPMPQTTSEPQYHWGCGDGPKEPDQGVIFETTMNQVAFKQMAQQYILTCGYTLSRQKDDSQFWYSKGAETESLYLGIEPATNGLHVSLELDVPCN